MQRMRDSGVDAIMLGRATLGNPWLISQIADLMEGREAQAAPSQADRLRFAIVHYKTMIDELGESRAVNQMRKHIALYLKGVPGAAQLRNELMTIDPADIVIGLIEHKIAELESGVFVAA
jgi:tRNA-dihydrouridine synthase